MDNTREKMIDVFMHIGDHVRSLDEYGFCFDSTLAKAIEDVVAMLKNQDANGVTLDNQVSSSKWIPVTERLPNEDGTYLVCTAPGTVTTARFYAFKSFPATKHLPALHRSSSWQSNRNVTHWMPLPEAPKGE